MFFEPVPDAALVLGLDLGARFARGAVCDLTGDIRVRQDVELTGSGADAALAAISAVTASLVAATGSPRELIGRAVVGVPGVVDDRGRLHLTHFRSLEGVDLGRDLSARLGLDVTLVNDINLAALGEESQGVARGIDDFAFLSVGTGLGIGLVLGGELHTGRNGAAGEIDYALLGFGGGFDPSAVGVSACAAELAEARAVPTIMAPPYEPREIFAAARRGDVLAREVVAEVARRIALHIAPVAAVADVGLVVLGGGIGANGDLLLEPVRDLLATWLPSGPKLEISSLGEAAVLSGALAVGLRMALDDLDPRRDAVCADRVSASGRIPTTTSEMPHATAAALAARETGTAAPPSETVPFVPHVTVQRFIAGDPMNPATKALAGRS